MSDNLSQKLRKLCSLAALVKEAALSDLARASMACETTQRKLRALEAPIPTDSSLPLPVVETAALLHQRWSEPRRRRLLEDLALQTARRLECEAAARRALGRAQIVNQLRKIQQNQNT